MNPDQHPGPENTAPNSLLGRQFQQMRGEDAAVAPVFPAELDSAELRYRNVNRRLRGALVKTAMAASVLLVAGLLVTQRSEPEDPAALYADIMGDYQLQTDDLLYVSGTLAPEMLGLPEVLDAGLSQDSNEGIN